MTLEELQAWGEPIRKKAAAMREECERQLEAARRVNADSARIQEEAWMLVDSLPQPFPLPPHSSG